MAKLDHRHHRKCHQGRRNLLLCTSALFTTASISVLLMSIAPKLGVAETDLFNAKHKFKIPEVIPITSSTNLVGVVSSGNSIKPGDGVPAKNFGIKEHSDLIKSVKWSADPYTRYMLMLVDIDRKSNPNATIIYNQYTNLNIPGNEISSGQTIVPYEVPSVPCKPSSKHRLLILVFQQDQNIDIADIAYIAASPNHPERRELAKFKDFTEQHRLSLIGANIFNALGEVNGTCSAATTLQPNILTLSSSIIVVIVMFQLVSSRQRS